MLFSDGDSALRHSAIPSGEGLDEHLSRSPLSFFITSHGYLKTGVLLLKNSSRLPDSQYALFSGDAA
jgi:hypothetical protein